MFKWILIVLGIIFLWGGLDNHFNYSAGVNKDVRVIQPSEIGSIIAGTKKQYVRLAANLDLDTKIFPTYLEHPKFTFYGPREVHKVRPSGLIAGQDGAEYLGSWIELQSPLSGAYLELMYIRGKGDDAVMEGSFYFAPVAGSNEQVWIVSPSFSSTGDDDDKREAWLQQSSFTGRLSYFRDLKNNLKNLAEETGKVTDKWRQATGRSIMPNSYVVLAHRPMNSESATAELNYFTGVEDIDSLFVETNAAEENEIVSSGMIEGILTPYNSTRFREFAELLDEGGFPPRIGIISKGSGEDEHAAHDQATKIGVVGGLLMLMAGFYLFTRARRT